MLSMYNAQHSQNKKEILQYVVGKQAQNLDKIVFALWFHSILSVFLVVQFFWIIRNATQDYVLSETKQADHRLMSADSSAY